MQLKNFKFLWLTMVLLSSSPLLIQYTDADTKGDAENIIDSAQGKFVEALHLLEQASIRKINVADLTIQTDEARFLIRIAETYYQDSNYSLAVMNANAALNILIPIIEGVNSRISAKKQSSELLLIFLISGIVLITIYSLFLFYKKLYPIYKKMQIEAYEDLEIAYETETVGENNE